MTDREKLAKLVCESINHVCANYCNLTSEIKCAECTCIADHLLANGVTFAKDTDVPSKWISVEDELPEIEGRYLCVKSLGKTGIVYVQLMNYDGCGFCLDHIYCDNVTHWMPPPEAPKEDKT